MLRRSGVSNALVDTGAVVHQVHDTWPGGAEKVLELIGTNTLQDSLQCARAGGVVCMSGIVGDSWTLDGCNPMESRRRRI